MTPVELLQQLIRFDTTNPPGNESECIGFVRNLLEEAGCERQTYAKDTDPPNPVSRPPGPGGSPPPPLQAPSDVVTPPGPSGADPPFGGAPPRGRDVGPRALARTGPARWPGSPGCWTT